MSKKIAIYGGAFDPPTLGHTHVITKVLETGLVDEVWVLPAYKHFHEKKMTRFDQRLRMCEDAFLHDSRSITYDTHMVKVKDYERSFTNLNDDYDGSTSSMLNNLRMHRSEDFFIVIGQDNAHGMSKWKNGNQLIANERFIVLPRPTNEFPAVHFIENADVDNWYSRGGNHYLKNAELLNVSSTMARELCKRHPLSILQHAPLEYILCYLVRLDIDSFGLYTDYTGGNTHD